MSSLRQGRVRCAWMAGLAPLFASGCALIFGFEDPLPAAGSPASASGQGGGAGEGTGATASDGGGGSGAAAGASASAGGQGGDGGAPVCEPLTTTPCYDGPPSTENEGPCHGGTATCKSDGSGYGPCEDQVLPSTEDCNGNIDENCDSKSDCKGNHVWSKRFGDASNQRGQGIAVDANGSVFVTGDYAGTIDFGGADLVSAGGDDVFVAGLAANGDHVWSKRFGGGLNQSSRDIALDASGNVVFGEVFEGLINLGGGTLLASGTSDVYLGRLAGADGAHVFSERYSSASSPRFIGVATWPNGDVAVAGSFGESFDLGDGPHTSAGSNDILVGRLDAAGNEVWSHAFGDASSQVANSVAVDANGDVIVCGVFAGTLTMGTDMLTSAGDIDVFVAKLDGDDGSVTWAKRMGSTAEDGCWDVATFGGMSFVAGRFSGTVAMGPEVHISNGGEDAFVIALGANGNVQWGTSFGGTGNDAARSVAVDALGQVVLAGDFETTMEVGSDDLTSVGLRDLFVAKLDGQGDPVWAKSYGDASDQGGPDNVAVALDSLGSPVFIATLQGGAINFGGGALAAGGGEDVVVVKLSP